MKQDVAVATVGCRVLMSSLHTQIETLSQRYSSGPHVTDDQVPQCKLMLALLQNMSFPYSPMSITMSTMKDSFNWALKAFY